MALAIWEAADVGGENLRWKETRRFYHENLGGGGYTGGGSKIKIREAVDMRRF